MSARSVESAHAVLRAALKDAVRQGVVARNVTDAVKPPRPVRKEMKVLSAEQARTLVESTRDDRFGPLWALLVTTGLRIGEAFGLTWDDVDLDGRRLVVRRALQCQKEAGLVLAEPRTGRSQRTVHLSQVAVAALREQRKRQAAGGGLAAGPHGSRGHRRPSGAFPSSSRSLTAVRAIRTPLREAFLAALERAGLPAIRVHDLRHTAATILPSRGTHPKIVQELLGHSTITMTMDTYSAYVPAMHEDAARQMDAALGAL